jgi:hypothetical protein
LEDLRGGQQLLEALLIVTQPGGAAAWAEAEATVRRLDAAAVGSLAVGLFKVTPSALSSPAGLRQISTSLLESKGRWYQRATFENFGESE